MSSFRTRPRFSQHLSLPPSEVENQIASRISASDHRCIVKRFPGYLTLRIPDEDQHFWSPQLTLSLNPDGDGGTEIVGIYGPNTNVWAMFLYGYLTVGTLGAFTGIFGIAQWVVGAKAWGLIPFFLFLLFFHCFIPLLFHLPDVVLGLVQFSFQ